MRRHGRFDIELEDGAAVEQAYVRNTAILSHACCATADGRRVEIIDFAPRFQQNDRIYSPSALVRHVRRLAGRPRVRVRYGRAATTARTSRETPRQPSHPLRRCRA